MNQNSSEQPGGVGNENLQSLFEKWKRRHTALENYVLVWFVSFKLLQPFKIKFGTWQGNLLRFLFIGLSVFGIPLIITAATQQWSNAPIWKWAIVAFGFGAMTLNYPLYHQAGMALASFYGTIQDVGGIYRMKAWDRRWFSLGFASTAGVLFAVIALIALLNTQSSTAALRAPLGTLFLFFILAYQIGENTYNSILVGIESLQWSNYRFELFPISPIETFALQKAIKGFDLIVFLNSIFMTFMIAGSALLLSGISNPESSFLLVLLLIAYLVIGLLFFFPRLAAQRIIRSAKIRELLPLQDKLNAFYVNYEELTTEDYVKFRRTEEIYNKIKDSQDSLLRLDSAVRIIGNLLLPTITFYLSVVAEVYLSILLENFFR